MLFAANMIALGSASAWNTMHTIIIKSIPWLSSEIEETNRTVRILYYYIAEIMAHD